MPPPSLPRYFVSRAPDADGTTPEAVQAAHVVDCFRLAGGSVGAVEGESIAAADGLGNLMALPDRDRDGLSATVQAELAYHEVSGARRTRVIDASELFLFHLQLLEQPAQCPGVDDPVYLYGTLFGPYPTAGGPAPGFEGQLTVTRVDLLDGLARGAEYAFRYPAERGEAGPGARCFHMAVPGDREAEIARGSGMVLAYPLLPPELSIQQCGNEIIVRQLLFDLLSALRDDLLHERVPHPLCSLALPVPSRTAVQQELEARGYEIQGETAVKRAATGGGFQGFLASVFGSLMDERLALPREGTVDEFLQLARQTLDAIPGFPPSRTRVLRARTTDAPPAFMTGPARTPGTIPAVPRPTAAPPTPPPRLVPQPRPGKGPPDWMQDFMAAHRRPGAPPPRLTSTDSIRASPGSRRSAPDWMRDFETPAPADPPPRSKSQPPEGSPDWMKDFE